MYGGESASSRQGNYCGSRIEFQRLPFYPRMIIRRYYRREAPSLSGALQSSLMLFRTAGGVYLTGRFVINLRQCFENFEKIS